MKLFTKVKTVIRDFSQTYKNAINEALPKAIQIVDRFHIFKNLTDDLNDYLKRNIADRTKMIDRKGKEGIEEEIIFSKKPRRLNKWIKDAKKINVKELNSFITLIESDIEAVKNAIKYDYSNGLTEGFNNKTKVIKRIMYGRCSFNLLRLKILA